MGKILNKFLNILVEILSNSQGNLNGLKGNDYVLKKKISAGFLKNFEKIVRKLRERCLKL